MIQKGWGTYHGDPSGKCFLSVLQVDPIPKGQVNEGIQGMCHPKPNW